MSEETIMVRKSWSILFVLAILGGCFQLAEGQDNKSELVNKLVGLTIDSHPSVMEKRLAENKVDANKYQAEERRDYAELLTSALKENGQLTAEQKTFARKNVEKLVNRMAFEILVIQERNNNSEKWLKESLRQNYSAKLTLAELKNLAEYFATQEGENALNYIATSPERSSSGKPNYEPGEFLAYSDLIKTPLGEKFFNIFVTDAEADLNSKFLAGNKKMRTEIIKFYKPGSLNQIINQFVTANNKK
jgi:hypothetical protein